MRSVRLTSYPFGMIKEENFIITEEPTPSISENEILVENIYCSTEPYQRGRMIPPPKKTSTSSARTGRFPPIELGGSIAGETVGKVIESKSSLYNVGDYIMHTNGWEDYSVLNILLGDPVPRKINITGDADEDCLKYIVTRGLVARTAYYSLVHCMNVQPGDVVAVSGAMGGVGHMLIQLALKLGASKVYGITSTEEKAKQVSDLGGTPIVVPKNAKLNDLMKIIDSSVHDEINHYHENVSNSHFMGVMKHMAIGGTMVYCGAMSLYNATMPSPGPNIMSLIYNDVTIKGCFLSNLDADSFHSFMDQHADDLTYFTSVYDGLNQIPTQFCQHFVLPDSRMGKSVCKL